MASQWSGTAAFVFIGVFLMLAFFEVRASIIGGCECLGFAVVLTLLPCDAFTDQAAGLHGPEQRAARQAR